MTDSDTLECRICLEPSVRRDLIAPCSCTGTRKWVHRDCLNKWRVIREDRAFSKCTECLSSYKLIASSMDSGESRRLRQLTYFFYIVQDFTILFVVIQLMILLLSLIVYGCDKGNGFYLMNFLHMNGHLTIFYYICGLVLLLAILGFTSMSFYAFSNGNSNRNYDCCDCYPPGYYGYYYYYYNPWFCFGPPMPVQSDPCCSCCACCDSSSLGATGSRSDGCCDGDCNNSECGKEMVVVLLVVVAIFAIIGLFLSIFIGMIVIQRILQRHLHLLKKKSLVVDYVVLDLAAESESGSPNNSSTSNGHDMEQMEAQAINPNQSRPWVFSSDNSNKNRTIEESTTSPLVTKGNNIKKDIQLSSYHNKESASTINPLHEPSSSPVCIQINGTATPTFTPTPPHQSNLTTHQIEELTKLGLL